MRLSYFSASEAEFSLLALSGVFLQLFLSFYLRPEYIGTSQTRNDGGLKLYEFIFSLSHTCAYVCFEHIFFSFFSFSQKILFFLYFVPRI